MNVGDDRSWSLKLGVWVTIGVVISENEGGREVVRGYLNSFWRRRKLVVARLFVNSQGFGECR